MKCLTIDEIYEIQSTYQSVAGRDGHRRFRMAFHSSHVVTLLMSGRRQTVIGHIASLASFDDERRSQKSIVGLQMQLLLAARQFKSIVNLVVVVVVVVVHLASTSPLSSRRIVVMVCQVMTQQLPLFRHFPRHDHFIVTQTFHQIS